MLATALIAGLLMAQAPMESLVVQGGRGQDRTDWEHVDVGYAELAQGRPAAAIDTIRANREIEPGDPAALINLGTASARLGRTAAARDYYSAAAASPARYDLQLADGRWMDSRNAARTAIQYLDSGRTLAVR